VRRRRRTSGSEGTGGGPASPRCAGLAFPPEPQVLQEGEGELAQQGVVVQAAPRAALEMVQPQLVLELLVHLFADPACFDQRCQDLERRVGGMVRQVVFALAGGAVLADKPRLLTRQALGSRRDGAIGHPHPQGGELGPKWPFGAGPPGDGAECLRPRLEQFGRRHARR
jgi:hypothetical protein